MGILPVHLAVRIHAMDPNISGPGSVPAHGASLRRRAGRGFRTLKAIPFATGVRGPLLSRLSAPF